MTWSLQQLASGCREILATDNTPAGRTRVAGLVAQALSDRAFIADLFARDVGERKVVYEDPKLGFCLLAHEYRGAKQGGPHDHGPSWAIYGQAEGETMMSDFARVEPPAGDRPGKARRTRSYRMQPGDVHVYNEGDLHAPSRSGPTRLLRVEGVNMDTVQRARYEVVEGVEG